jgi:hypothetical protein
MHSRVVVRRRTDEAWLESIKSFNSYSAPADVIAEDANIRN